MKTIPITLLSALLMGSALCLAEPPATDKETMTQKMKDFWIKSKGYLSEDWATFKEGAQQTLSDLNKEIDAVAAKPGASAPVYFQTRVQSLRQQHEHLSAKLGELNSESIKTRLSGPRYAFDKGVASLEAALAQADSDADTIVKITSPEKDDDT